MWDSFVPLYDECMHEGEFHLAFTASPSEWEPNDIKCGIPNANLDHRLPSEVFERASTTSWVDHHHAKPDHTGERHGKLTVIGPARKSAWVYRCDCGKEKIAGISIIRNSKSCGCEKHLKSRERPKKYIPTKPATPDVVLPSSGADIYVTKYLLALGCILKIASAAPPEQRGYARDIYGELYSPGEWSLNQEMAEARARLIVQRKKDFYLYKLNELSVEDVDAGAQQRRHLYTRRLNALDAITFEAVEKTRR